MANKIILFTSPKCGACIQQEKILREYFKDKRATIYTINIDKFPQKFKFVKFTPTWAFPMGGEKYKLYTNIIDDPKMLMSVNSFGSRKSRFGEKLYDGINNLAVYGKNFPDNKGFEIPNSFYQDVENKWGKGDETFNAGLGSRGLGPGNSSEMYSNNYVNNIRMAQPADQLGTALYMNRTCNTMHKPSSMLEDAGMIYNASNPQIVNNTTGFGYKKRSNRFSRFGSGLYQQMGPASEIGNQYLISKNTGKQLFSGARQDELPRPQGVQNKQIYVGQATEYRPNMLYGKRKAKKTVKAKKLVKDKKAAKAKNENSGKKAVNIKISIKRRSKIGEGSVLRIGSSNKIKVI